MKQKGLRMSTVLLLALIGTVLVVLLSILLLSAVVILIAMLIISAILSHVLSPPIRGLAAAMEQFEQNAESYMQIQSRRYKNQFAYTFDVQESCLDYLCNKITLQPILENAICHGINDLMRDGEIAVSVREDGDDVVFTVADNGSGMSGEQIISAAGNTPVIFFNRAVEGDGEEGTVLGGNANIAFIGTDAPEAAHMQGKMTGDFLVANYDATDLNSAGKSTLMKCLFGIYGKDSGHIYLEGKEVNFKSSREALDNGVAMVHQELNRALKRSVMDNIWLGRYPMIAGVMVDESMTLAAKYV